MTEETETEVQEPEQKPAEQYKPGKLLRETREAKGLTRQEVAAQLRLQVRLIEALEEDNEAELPPSTFVSGYLRSYARLLELPEESVVTSQTRESAAPLVSSITDKGEASSRDWPARLMTYLIVVAMIVSISMWWLSQRVEDEPPVVAESETEMTAQEGDVDISLPDSLPDEDETGMATSDSTDETAEEGTGMEEGEAGQEQATADQEPAVQETPETQSASSPQIEAAPNQGGGPQPITDSMPQSKLELRFNADSWTEVTDSAGRQLTYGLVKAGNVLVLRGEAPFRVFLGYAVGVDVYYNGRHFDHTPFQRRDVARFRVGRAEHNHPGSR